MAKILFETKISITDTSNATISIPTMKSLSFTAKEDKEFVVAASGTQTLWDTTTDSTEATSDFDFLYIIANSTIDLEFTTNEGHASEELCTMRVIKDVPFILGADDSYYDHSASDAYAGTLDVIDKIRAKEVDASSVTIRMILAT